jgi:putative tryptophan/tyrosine transport system substrate-binding protein
VKPRLSVGEVVLELLSCSEGSLGSVSLPTALRCAIVSGHQPTFEFVRGLGMNRNDRPAPLAGSVVGGDVSQTRRQFMHAGIRMGAQAAIVSASFGMGGRLARAQSPANVTRVGFVAAGPTPTMERPNMFLKAFQEGLQTLGLAQSETFVIESRFAEGNFERIPGLVADLGRLDVKAIFVPGTPAATIVKRETAIPLVMIGDPVGAKLAASLERPGGTVTGFASNPEQIVAHRVKLLKTVVPGLTRAGFVAKPDNPAIPGILRMTRIAAEAAKIDVIPVDVQSEKDVEVAFETMIKRGVQGFIFYPVPMQDTRVAQLAQTAIERRLPWLDEIPRNATLGALLGYGPDYPELARRAADYVAKILKGARPEDLPIGVPSKFEFVANLQTARAIGVTIPDSVLTEATKVVR